MKNTDTTKSTAVSEQSSAGQASTGSSGAGQSASGSSGASQSGTGQSGSSKSGSGKKILIGCVLVVLITLCCAIIGVFGLVASGASIFTLSGVEVRETDDASRRGDEMTDGLDSSGTSDGSDSGSDAAADSSSLIAWPNTAYYLIGCDLYEVTPAAATKITAVVGLPPRAKNDYCSTGGFGEVTPVSGRFVLSVQNGSTGDKQTFFLDLVAKTAKKLPKPANYNSPNVLRTDYAYNPATNMTMVYQLIGSGDYLDPTLTEISPTGKESGGAVFESRLAAGRGGIIGDEVNIAYNSSGEYILINDTTAGPISTFTSESFVAVVKVSNGERLANLAGLKARWVSPTKFVYQSGSIMGSSGDRKLYIYDINTESSSVLTPSETFGVIAEALATQQGYLLTHSTAADTFGTKLINSSTGSNTVISVNPLAQRVGGVVYSIELRKCEIKEAFGAETESLPGAVLCPMGDGSGLYTHRLMRTEGGKSTVAAEFEVKFPF